MPDLVQLEQVARSCAVEWGVELGPPFALSRYSYVAPAGDGMVLKVRSFEDDESDEEADALLLWAGEGSVRLLRQDPGRRVILIERAWPGGDISQLPEADAAVVAVDVGRRLWRPAGLPFRWIGDHVPRWLDEAERLSELGCELIPLARELYASLEVGRSTLVHGDFHHHNILDAGGRFVAIDPKPMLGEPEFDVPPFLWNGLVGSMTLETTRARIGAFVAAGLNGRRIAEWSVVRGAYLGVDEPDSRLLRRLL